MKKLDNFSNCLNSLKGVDFEFANENDIYRTGVIGQFNLTFELAWKALQAVLREHGGGRGYGIAQRDFAAWLQAGICGRFSRVAYDAEEAQCLGAYL